jgi:predicted PurR-regulated permease PerM
MQKHARDVTRTMLIILFVSLLGSLSVWVLAPFLPAMIWATMLVIATWPMMLWMQTKLNNNRLYATTGMVLFLLLIVILPSMFAIEMLMTHMKDIADFPSRLQHLSLSPLPTWVSAIPLVGKQISEHWQLLATQGLSVQLAPYSGELARWLLIQLGNVSLLFLNFVIVIFISAVLYISGEKFAFNISRFATKLAGARGAEAITLAAQAIRAVALGVIVTAIVQALLGGFGMLIAGLSYVGLCTLLMFMLSVAQIGAAPVTAVAAVILLMQGQYEWGIFMVAWTVFIGTIDNVIRPIFIKRAAHLPLLLVFAGVIGGMLSFGIIGMFIGPTVLAVTHTLLNSWIHDEGEDFGL